jgi:hypothetical protein
MRNDPRRVRAAPGVAFLCVDAPQPRPFASGKRSHADESGEFLDFIKLAYYLSLNQGGQKLFDPLEPFVGGHS